jgi:erythromycin esterase
MFGDKMVVFGFSFNQGSFQSMSPGKGLRDFTVPPAPAGSLDGTLAATGIPLFVLDLRQAPRTGPITEWLNAPHQTRSIGAGYDGSEFGYMFDMRPAASFDALIFVEKTTAARRNPSLTE